MDDILKVVQGLKKKQQEQELGPEKDKVEERVAKSAQVRQNA